jgi:hypothetical protein
VPTRRELVLLQRNDENVRLNITQDDTGDPQDLTGVTVEVFIKPNAETADDDDAVTVLSTATSDIVVDPPGSDGIAILTVPAEVTATAGESWWRADCVVSGDRKTAMYGPFIVRDL